ncbi:MAG: extracellular solute-binding protein [Treponema sp.]|jgi:putative aldouronate transport system substrate-binding protein|nr:extracellular solute-binding protein [Treponema sp.]
MFKKMITAIGLLTLISTLVFAGGAGQKKAPGAVKVLSAVTGGKDDAENLLFQQALEKATGLSISFEKVPANYYDTLTAKLGAGEVYDLVYLNQTQMYSLARQGALSDLTSRLRNSPVIRDNYPAGELEKTVFEGKYYGGFNKQEVYLLPNVNKAITDKAGIDISNLSTLEDYYNLLKKVKEYKENVEGKKPYYPYFCVLGDVWDLQPWFSAAGVRRGVFTDSSGKRYAPYVSPAAQPVWEWFKKLYDEGLLDPASFTGKSGDMRPRMWQSQDIVLDSDWAAWTGLYNANAKVAGTYPAAVNVVPLPGVKGPSGKYFLEQGEASLWAIPVSAANPDGAFKIIEYFATREGGLLLSAGIEGHDYNLVNGKVALTETGTAHARDHGAPFPISSRFDLGILGELNPGLTDAIAIGKRSDVAVEPMGYDNGKLEPRQYYDVVAKWLIDTIQGKTGAAQAINSAAAELRGKGIID